MTPDARYLLVCTPTPLQKPDFLPPGLETDRFNDAYVIERRTRKVIRASVPVRGRNPNEWACTDSRTANLDAAISDDGRRVAFQAGASNLVRGDRNHADDIFVRDLAERRTYRVPIPGSKRLLRGPTMSGNGRFVFFGRRVKISGRTRERVYLHDLRTRRTTLISTAPDGRPLAEDAYVIKASSSGRLVVIATGSPELTGRYDRENPRLQLFVKDLKTRVYHLVSRGIDGQGFAGGFNAYSLSSDGRYLAFATIADNVVAGDTNREIDSFWLDRVTGRTVRLSLRANERERPRPHWFTAISADGRWAAWASSDPEFWPGEPTHPPPVEETDDVFIRGPMH